ncbi:MAG: hypothetical protein DRJ08_04600 [Acidobacteria bacterium]|nr:MAG: hypothetical protein DRJ14_00750 [Acidobacteriota bacterium]RLE22103.1 MAG: hypothetical protein DRJ08_04600 [Acidobacteriota bacterium]
MNRMFDFVQRNRKFYLVLGVLLLLNILFFILSSSRELRLYNDSAEVLRETSVQVRNARRRATGAEKIASNVSEAQKRIHRFFNSELSRGGDPLSTLNGRIYNILISNHMNFQHISYDRKPELKGMVNRIVIHVPVKSGYEDFQKLIRDLEQIPFPVFIDRVSISSVTGGEISATVDIVTFYGEKKS